MPRRLRLSGNLIVLLAKDYDRMSAELERLREMERHLAVRLGHGTGRPFGAAIKPTAGPPLARAVREIERAKTEEIP